MGLGVKLKSKIGGDGVGVREGEKEGMLIGRGVYKNGE